jgi:hypothetical protein
MSKRTNKPYTEYFIVGTGDQAVKTTGNINTTGNAVNIAAGQIGIIAARNFGTYSAGDFIAAGDDITDIPEVKIVQGTANSADTSGLLGWFNEIPAFVETPVIKANSIQSFSSRLAPVDTYSSVEIAGFDDPEDETRYVLNMSQRSVRKDRDYGANVDQMSIDYITGDLTGIGDPKDFLIQNLAYNFNLNSAVLNTQPSWQPSAANKRWIAFVINAAGAADGTVVGDIALGDVIPVMTINGTAMNFTADRAFLQTVNEWITNSSNITAASTIQVINLAQAGEGSPATGTITMTNVTNLEDDVFTINGVAFTEGVDWARGGSTTTAATALAAAINADPTSGVSASADAAVVTLTALVGGTAGNAITLTYTDANPASVGGTVSGSGTLAGATADDGDVLVLMGLEHTLAVGHDDIYARKIRLDATISDTFINGTATVISDALEALNSGRNLKIWYDQRAFAQTGSNQLAGFSDSLVLRPSPIDESAEYTVHTLDIYHEDVINNDHIHNQTRIWFLLESEDDSSTTDAETGVTTSTADTTTVTSLNASIGAWLLSNQSFQISGDSTTTDLFV